MKSSFGTSRLLLALSGLSSKLNSTKKWWVILAIFTTVSVVTVGLILYPLASNQPSPTPASPSSPSKVSAVPGANPDAAQVVDSTLLKNLAGASPPLGSESAPITIYEFADYQCPNCQSWWISVKPLLVDKFIKTGKAKLIMVEFPFLGKDSFSSAQAAKCAGEQGRYWEYHDTLYSEQKGIDTGWASIEKLKKFASELGLDMEAFNTCLDSGKYSEIVKQSFKDGEKLVVPGTPTFFIVGPKGEVQKIVGSQPFVVFEKIIDSMLPK
ncbi:MAG: DsbA family protein [Thaumarchaeota archaeon]|nr:DsbA family protein [Nitrososphaerota archaeon]